jgi:hypothetical protein
MPMSPEEVLEAYLRRDWQGRPRSDLSARVLHELDKLDETVHAGADALGLVALEGSIDEIAVAEKSDRYVRFDLRATAWGEECFSDDFVHWAESSSSRTTPYLHIAGATMWVGGAAMLQFMAMRPRSRGLEGIVAFGSDVTWLGNRVLAPRPSPWSARQSGWSARARGASRTTGSRSR